MMAGSYVGTPVRSESRSEIGVRLEVTRPDITRLMEELEKAIRFRPITNGDASE